MVFLENVVGQYTQKGPMQAFAQICPIMKGGLSWSQATNQLPLLPCTSNADRFTHTE